MAKHEKSRRSKRKRQDREYEQWLKEQREEGPNDKTGEFVVLLWPDMVKTKPMNWNQAEKIWRNHSDRAMIFSSEDFTSARRKRGQDENS
jgi:hypothetical protein